MLDPVIIVGVPRSRTSLTTAIFHFCGMQIGDVMGANSNNKKGQFENREIVNKVEKPYLKSLGYDPKGQYPLPNPKKLPIDISRKDMVLNIAKKQGIDTSKIWGFKDTKYILSFYSWLYAFPKSTWIIVHRKKQDIVKSCNLTPFMSKRKDWGPFVDEFRQRFELLKQEHNSVYEVNSDDIISFKLDSIKNIIEKIGLTWEEQKIKDFIDPTLTRLKN